MKKQRKALRTPFTQTEQDYRLAVAAEFKVQFMKNLEAIPKHYSLSLSGGIDSLQVLYGLMDLGKPPVECITFKMKSVDSPDLEASREVCKKLNLVLKSVEIPDDPQSIYNDSKEILEVIRVPKKTHVQCTYPHKYMIPLMITEHLVAGTWSGYFLTAEKKVNMARMKMKPDEFKQWYKEFRQSEWDHPGHSFESIKKYVNSKGINYIEPYLDNKLMEISLKCDFYDWNCNEDGTFKHKYLQYMMFKDWFDKIGIWRKQASMQIITGIREQHARVLADQKLNKRGKSDMRAVYNDIMADIDAAKGTNTLI
jgi:asparagine synthetase B (glutamine-hydrolysing)